MKKALSILLSVLLLSVSAAALAEGVSIAATSVPHAEILEFIKPMMAEKGYELEIVIFDDYIQPNNVVESGEIDANYFQHTNYLYSFNKDNGTHLVPVIPVHFEPMGVFKGMSDAQVLDSLDDLPEGARIAVPNDTSNEARALQLLAKHGVIELNPDAGVTATKLDITVNDKNIEIVELEAAQLPRVLPDFDFAVINGNYALAAGLSLSTDAIAAEESDAAAYPGGVNYVVVKEGNEEAPYLDALREALNDQSTQDFINEKYQGSVILALDAEIPPVE